MGPAWQLSVIADSLDWARSGSLVILPIVLNGPSVASKICCQWSWMGPALPLRFAADGLGWAQSDSLVTLLTALTGPSLAALVLAELLALEASAASG
jgi:hypothetical protein